MPNNLYGGLAQAGGNLAQQLMAQRPMGPPAPGGPAGGMAPNIPKGFNQMGPIQQPNRNAAMLANYAQGQAAGQNMDWMKQQNPNMQFPQQQQGPMGPSTNMIAQQLQQLQKPFNPMGQMRPQPTQPPMMGQMRPQMPQQAPQNMLQQLQQRMGGNTGIRGPMQMPQRQGSPYGRMGYGAPAPRPAPPMQNQRPMPPQGMPQRPQGRQY